MTRFMNRWQKSIPLLSKIHFVRSLMIDDEMMVGRVFFVSKENSIRGMDGALRYCRCGFCKRIARNRSLALCVFPSRFPLLSPSPPPPVRHLVSLGSFLSSCSLVPLVLIVLGGDHERTTTCQIIRVESEKFKKYSKFNYPGEPRSFEIVRAANGWLKNSRSTNRATNF